ncbi:LPXTG cell wall anchor domain-containing protein [Lactococcus lactis]|uniref:LPXTG cell wall anchor domain-containing protein n=1 Tax=Lactococcus lactis TaxID=1358 RepID=UPI0024163EE5|nr:LPXTG cell wall anchor domain-containing protein [Lactococcus lactis]MDG4960590.1 LPXTG cell wall anchor domain-containing protein [Lactococcus lactis]
MKKRIITVLVIVPWLVCAMFPIKVSSATYQQEVSIIFVDNPNLPRAPAPGIAPGENPIIIGSIGGKLPKTNDTNSNLLPLGYLTIFIAVILLYVVRKEENIK